MKKTIKKNIYNAPTVKVVAFQVEQGFQGSGDPVNISVGTLDAPATSGTQGYTEESTLLSGEYTGNYINN